VIEKSKREDSTFMNRIDFFLRTSALLIFSFIFAVLFCTGHLASPLTSYAGEIYRWIDEKGGVHFSDTAPDNSSAIGRENKRIQVDDSPIVDKGTEESSRKRSDTLRSVSSKDVIIYTLDT
jgi:hypothetical protein